MIVETDCFVCLFVCVWFCLPCGIGFHVGLGAVICLYFVGLFSYVSVCACVCVCVWLGILPCKKKNHTYKKKITLTKKNDTYKTKGVECALVLHIVWFCTNICRNKKTSKQTKNKQNKKTKKTTNRKQNANTKLGALVGA